MSVALWVRRRCRSVVARIALAGAFTIASCEDGTSPDSHDDLSGVWVAALEWNGFDDTLTLMIPDVPDSLAFSFRSSGGFGSAGVIRRAGRSVTGTFNTAGRPGEFTIDLTERGTFLLGTVRNSLPDDTSPRAAFVRFVPQGPSLAGTWVTVRTTGLPPGESYLDTLRLKGDGRAELATYGSPFDCSSIGLRGAYRREGGLLIVRYVVSPWTCGRVRRLDTLRIQGPTLTRTRPGGIIVETLMRR